MNEYKIQIEYGYHGMFFLVVEAPTMEEAVKTAMVDVVRRQGNDEAVGTLEP